LAEEKLRNDPKIEAKPKMTRKGLLLKVLNKIAPNINVTIKDKLKEEEHEIIAPTE
jgi:hypothetical protein